jgi:glutathione synthase/RimK-type ligase-like ATP-grasp enzyme
VEFPPAFLEEVNGRNAGVVAEYAKLGGTKMNEPCEYAVLIDRISHEIPYYRAYLKNAMLQGAYCINNPFWWSADDKFFGASLITRMGIPSPKTIVLPMKAYPEGVISESLRNLNYPLDWDAIVGYTGLPAILKDAWGGGWKNVYKVNTIDELIRAYDETGTLCMILQEFIEFDQFVRCICVGQDQHHADQVRPQKPSLHRRARASVVGAGRPHRGVRTAHQSGDGLRHEQHRVCGSRRRALCHRLHESGAGYGHQQHHAPLF